MVSFDCVDHLLGGLFDFETLNAGSFFNVEALLLEMIVEGASVVSGLLGSLLHTDLFLSSQKMLLEVMPSLILERFAVPIFAILEEHSRFID